MEWRGGRLCESRGLIHGIVVYESLRGVEGKEKYPPQLQCCSGCYQATNRSLRQMTEWSSYFIPNLPWLSAINYCGGVVRFYVPVELFRLGWQSLRCKKFLVGVEVSLVPRTCLVRWFFCFMARGFLSRSATFLIIKQWMSISIFTLTDTRT